MNPSNPNTPPGQPEAGVLQPEFPIGFALRIPLVNGGETFYPAGNVAGILLLKYAMAAGLRLRGIGFTGAVAGLDLNHAWGYYRVTDRWAGLREIHAVLAGCGLHHFAHSAWWDWDEGIWRHFQPQPSPVDFNTLFDPEALEDMCRQFQHKADLCLRAVAEQGVTP